jgi:hypothetical protein
MHRIEGMLDPAAGTVVQAALESLMAVRPDDDRSPAQRHADALAEIAEYACVIPANPPNPPTPATATRPRTARSRSLCSRTRPHYGANWAYGANTDKNIGVPLCRFHHWLIHHHTNWKIWRNHDNKIQVTRQ